MEQTGELSIRHADTLLERRLIEEILHHADILLDTSLTGTQREHLQRIRLAGGSLLASLPNPQPLAEPPYAQESTTAKKHLILLVEDNPFTQKLMTRLLTLQGYQVTLAQNGQEALECMAKTPFDLILMDLRMPLLDGFQTTEIIRQQEKNGSGKHIPIIAVTALVDEENKNRAIEVGMDSFHAKPVRGTVLFTEMERLLATEKVESPMVLDMSRLIKTVDGDFDLLNEITDLFFTDAVSQMGRIQNAFLTGDANEIREAAHRIKGATGTFGRIEVFHLAFALEQAGRQGDLQQANTLWGQLGGALHTMEEAIRKEITQLVGE
ncbi:MAG: response regulator [Magnetococcales bacterium]|nr:response regulator [Magnetococcales bacterium]